MAESTNEPKSEAVWIGDEQRPVVAVINYDHPEMTISIVANLIAHDPAVRDGDVCLIVVDAGRPQESFDKLHQLLESFPDIMLFRFYQRTDYSKVCNWIWGAFSQSPTFFFLNDDLIIPTPAISRMLGITKYDESIGILTPLMNTHGPGQHINTFIKEYPALPGWPLGKGKPTAEAVLQIDNTLQHLTSTGAIPPYLPSPYAVAFSCTMVKREVMDTLGGQDELFPYGLGADDDLCLRAVRYGWRVATAMDTFVGHIGGASLKQLGGDDIRVQTTKLIRRRWPPTAPDLISVIVPSYNCGRYLWNCLSSLLTQTYTPREIIVVDDGSTDETREVLERFNVIKVTNRVNMGAVAARNKGFQVSAGRYVVFCDADAVYQPTFLEELHSALVDTPDDIGYAYCDLHVKGRRNGTHYSGQWLESKLLAENFVCCASLIRRECFTGFDTALTRLQDWALWLDMWLNHGLYGVHVNKTLYTSLERGEGISGGGKAGLIMPGEVVREKYGI